MELIKILQFIDIVFVFPFLLGIILIDIFKILRLRGRIKVEITSVLFFITCIHTLALIVALIQI